MKEEQNARQVAVVGNAYTQAASAGLGGIVRGLVCEEPPAADPETECVRFPDLYPRRLIRPMTDEEIEPLIEALLRSMTFSEKCALLHGTSTAPKVTGCSSYVAGVPRLGVPAMIQHDGPAGVNSVYETTNLPVEMLAGCTFDPELAYAYGQVLGEELVSIGSNWQLGCQFDLSRHPFWMRSRDTYGEDYYLTAQMAAAQTRGVQEHGAGAMAKHMGAYCTNGDNLLSSWVDEQTLHTAYLYPFEEAAKKSRLASIMTTYTRLNGYFTASHVYMQKDTARGMWNWKGNMTTDAGGNQEVSVHLGTDHEMGMGFHNDESGVRAYIRAGLMTLQDVDTAVSHILWGYGAAGYLGLVRVDSLTGLAKQEPGRTEAILFPDTYQKDRMAGLYKKHNDIAVRIAEKGYVLLKNEDHALPLSQKDLTTGVALLGYGARHNMEGTGFERSFGVLEFMRSPGQALEELCGRDIRLTAEPVEDPHGTAIPASALYRDAEASLPGLERTCGIAKKDCYVPAPSFPFGMPPAEEGEDGEVMLPPGMAPEKPAEYPMEGFATGTPAGIDPQLEYLAEPGFFTGGTALPYGSAYTWRGWLLAPEDGEYTLAIHGIGGRADLRLYDGDRELAAAGITPSDGGHGPQWEFDEPTPEGMTSVRSKVTLRKGRTYRLLITARATYEEKDLQLRLAWVTPSQKQADHDRAIRAAEENPVVIYFAREGVLGHGGMNFTKFDLEVNDLDRLLEVQRAAKKAGSRFIVVVYSRSAFALDGDWVEDCDAVIAAFYPGQGGNTALARLLTGQANFSGKLCMTIPRNTGDTCVSESEELSRERRGNLVDMRTPITANFTEKLDFGYRWNARTGIRPGFAFGHGLSYTTFAYSDLTLTRTERGVEAEFTLTNTGDRAGDEVAQLYVGPGQAPEYVFFAKKQLCGFIRVRDLRPGEQRRVSVTVPERMLSYWDVRAELRTAPDGSRGKWTLAKGERTFYLGASSEDLPISRTILIE